MTQSTTPSTMLDDKSLMRILLGAVIGAAITVFVGFSTLGWMSENTAKDLAKRSASAAVVEALAPICADKFQHAANVATNKLALMKVNSSEQASFIEKGGWAKFPGNNTSDNVAVAEACAKIVSASK